MSQLSHFLDHETLAKLSETQVRTLNDQLEGELQRQLNSNAALKQAVGESLQKAAAAHLKSGH
jgi:hypothetical protein